MGDPIVGLDGTTGHAEPPPDHERTSSHQRDPDGRLVQRNVRISPTATRLTYALHT
jgi:hypothetical protein